jgi:formamidopyrimidine-DNA glycosylase
MPESAEVKIIADVLNKNLKDKKLISIEVNSKSRYGKDGQIPKYDQLHPLLPLKIDQIWSRGKVIMFQLEGDIYITSQLGMEGKWSPQPLNHSGVILTLEGEEKWYYDDTRHMGILTIYFDVESLEMIKFKEHGPDLLISALMIFDQYQPVHSLQIPLYWEEWLRCINNGRLSKKPIGEYLKEQKRFSGIGNYLRAHILYISKISPFRLLGQLNEEEKIILYNNSIKTVYESYKAGGLTVWTYMSPEGKRGTFKVLVYGQETDPEGNKVEQYKSKGKQTIWWVPAVQK